MENEHDVVVAIDIGTSRSGYALAFRHAPDRIVIPSGVKVLTALLTTKTKTCEFGNNALQRYLDSLTLGNDEELLYFEKFKMVLYDNEKENEKADEEIMIKSVNGKAVPARIVFGHCIRHLALDAMKRIRNHTASIIHEMKQVKWILTVPTIWSNKAKQLMRAAAEDALGGRECSIVLAYESECAALATLQHEQKSKEKEQVCVVDLGGGTADIVVQEMYEDGTVKNVMCATGGPWGATFVEEAVLNLLKDICGRKDVESFMKKYPDDYSMLRKGIETLISDVKQPFRRLLLPHSFISSLSTSVIESRIRAYNEKHSSMITDYFGSGPKTPKLNDDDDYETLSHEQEQGKEEENEEQSTEQSTEQNTQQLAAVHYYQGSLRFRSDVLQACFEPVLSELTDHLEDLLYGSEDLEKGLHDDDNNSNNKKNGIDRIYVVGGFAENDYVYDRLVQTFQDKTIHRPAQASLAVLTGGVLYGLKPSRVRSRIVPYTYGFVCSRVWDDDRDAKHDDGGVGIKVYHVTNGLKIPYCSNIFVPVVRKGEDVPHDAVRKERLFPVADDQVALRLKLLKCNGNAPEHYQASDLMWTECASIIIHIGSGRIDREITIEFQFGNTEINLHAFSTKTTPHVEYKTTIQF